MKDSIKSNESPKEQTRWSKSIRKNENTNSIEVEKLSNIGYIVEIRKEGKDKKGNWTYENKKYFSKTNPLIDDKEDDSIDSLAKELLGDKTLLTD